MRAVIESRFSTAEETGDVLGVPSSRVQALVNLTRPTRSDEIRALERVRFKASDSSEKASPRKRKSTKKSAARKRYARGKTANAPR